MFINLNIGDDFYIKNYTSKKIFKSRQDEQWQQLDHDEVDAYKITKLQPLLYKSTKQNKKDKLSNEESLMN